MLNFKSVENLTDLNNIPIPCPYLTIKFLLLFFGVVERWVNIRLFFFKEDYMITQVRMVTWVTKKNNISPKAYGLEK